MSVWEPGVFLVANEYGPVEEDGFLYRSLGMFQVTRGSPKGRRPPRWSLTHLGTGHRIVLIEAHTAQAFEIATEFAECTDWDFNSTQGWRDRDPDLMSKLTDLFAKYPAADRNGGRMGSEKVAQQIARMRA